jgi:hypothetical protein
VLFLAAVAAFVTAIAVGVFVHSSGLTLLLCGISLALNLIRGYFGSWPWCGRERRPVIEPTDGAL